MITSRPRNSEPDFSLCHSAKQDIQDRFGMRAQAERYRDRFKKGRRQATHLREVEALERAFESLSGIRVGLDVACGPGRFAEVLAGHCDRLIQTDFSRHMLDLSREDHPLNGKAGGYFQADARTIPLADSSVDFLFCHRFLNHVPDPEDRGRIIREFARVTSRYLVLSCLGPPRALRVFRRIYEKLKGKESLDGHVNVEDLIQNAEDAGLTLVGRSPIRTGIVSATFLIFSKAKHRS